MPAHVPPCTFAGAGEHALLEPTDRSTVRNAAPPCRRRPGGGSRPATCRHRRYGSRCCYQWARIARSEPHTGLRRARPSLRRGQPDHPCVPPRRPNGAKSSGSGCEPALWEPQISHSATDDPEPHAAAPTGHHVRPLPRRNLQLELPPHAAGPTGYHMRRHIIRSRMLGSIHPLHEPSTISHQNARTVEEDPTPHAAAAPSPPSAGWRGAVNGR